MENKQNDQQEVVNRIYRYAANLMMRENKNALQTRKILVEQGLHDDDALIVVTKLEEQIIEAEKERARRNMLYGGLWCVGGIIVTVTTYSAASGGGSYVVAWGATLFGGIQFIRGFLASY